MPDRKITQKKMTLNALAREENDVTLFKSDPKKFT